MQAHFVQDFLIDRITGKLSKELNTTVKADHVNIELFNKIRLNNFLILDRKKDTLLYTNSLVINTSNWLLLSRKLDLRYLGLEKAQININRDGLEWNYQFIADYFTPAKPRKKSRPINLDLHLIRLSDVTINQKDKWLGKDKYIHVGGLRLEAEQLDLADRKLRIRVLNIQSPNFTMRDYQGVETPPDSLAKSLNIDQKEDKRKWAIESKKVNIENGIFTLQKGDSTLTVANVFDANNIMVTNINLQLKNTRLQDDTLHSQIDLSLKERSGLIIKELTGDYTITPKSMEFDNLKLTTNSSSIHDHFSMHYDSFGEGMKDFIHKVRLIGSFDNAIVTSDDIAFFAPQVKQWNTVFNLNGVVSGEIDNLESSDIEIGFNNNSRIRTKFALSGLPDIDNTYIDADIDALKTNMTEVAKFIPAIKKLARPDLHTFGDVAYRGRVSGYIKNLNIDGNLETSIGKIESDLNLEFLPNQAIRINGVLAGTNFNAGKFIQNKLLGKTSFRSSIDGIVGANITNNLKLTALIDVLEFKNYQYKNINFDGGIRNEDIYGVLNIEDPNFSVNDLKAMYNFGKKESYINAEGTFNYVHLKNLNLFNTGNLSLKGHLFIDMKKDDSDDFFGTGTLSDAVLLNDTTLLPFDSLTVQSIKGNNSKTLTLETNELSGKIEGNYQLNQIGALFQSFLHHYYPSYVKDTKLKLDDQKFHFEINTGDISDFASLIDKKIAKLANVHINGEIDYADNIMALTMDAPEVFYDAKRIEGLTLHTYSARDTLSARLGITEIMLNDSTYIPRTILEAISSNDITNLHLYTPDDSLNYSVNLAAVLETYENGASLSINPSQILFNGETWTLAKDGQLAIKNDVISIQNLKFESNGQSIDIFSRPSDNAGDNDVFVNLKNINMGNILSLFITTPRLSGNLTTQIRITNPLPIDSSSISFRSTIDRFIFEDFEIGTVSVSGNYDAVASSLFTSIQSNDTPYHFNANLLYQKKDVNNPLSGTINFTSMKIDILNNYLAGIAEEVNGEAHGILNVSGKLDDPKMNGEITLNNTSLVVDYTKCKYSFADNSRIKFNSDEMNFEDISLRDANGNTASLKGIIRHKFFTNFSFDNFRLTTSNRFQLLNTTAKDNNQFYGKVIGQANLTINGPAEDLVMNISGTPTDSSHIFLPIGTTAETKGVDYIDFIKFGREMEVDRKANHTSNISVNIEINATPLATVDVILDETTGDVIKANGSGKLIMTAGTSDPFTIRGRYVIEGGEYTFNFQTFLKTPFILQQGYIEWQGDPYQAILNVDATYQAQNVNLSAIPTSTGYTNTLGDIDVIILLRGTLRNPDPDFEFQFTFNNPLKSDPIASEFLRTRYQSNKNEMLSQVASLLLFNTFMSDEQGGAQVAAASTSFLGKTAGQLISSMLTSSLNGWLQRTLNTNAINLYTNISPTDLTFQPSENGVPVQNIGNFGVRYAFHNNKYIFYLGSNLNYRVNPGIANNNADVFVTPDFSFEMLITPSGNLRVVGFNRSDLDPINLAGITSRNRTGVQLSYRKDFESFQDFFTGTGMKRKRGKE